MGGIKMSRKDRIEGQLKLIEVVGKRIEQLESENKRLKDALVELVETSMSNERQLAESFLEKFEPSSALIAANKALSQEGEI